MLCLTQKRPNVRATPIAHSTAQFAPQIESHLRKDLGSALGHYLSGAPSANPHQIQFCGTMTAHGIVAAIERFQLRLYLTADIGGIGTAGMKDAA